MAGKGRHELLPGGRYDEARGKRRSAYRGRYWIKGDHIEYLDDTGFTADGISATECYTTPRPVPRIRATGYCTVT